MLTKLKEIPVDSKEHIVDNVSDHFATNKVMVNDSLTCFRMTWILPSQHVGHVDSCQLKCCEIKMGNGSFLTRLKQQSMSLSNCSTNTLKNISSKLNF